MPLFNPPYIPDLYVPSQSLGDVVYRGSTSWQRLSIGPSGSYLYTSGSSIPRWTTELSGSLQRLQTGETFLAAGANVTIVTQSNGQVVISTSATGSSGPAASTTPYSDQLGEVFLATVTQSVYRKSLPITTQNGWLVNDLGMMLVTTSTVDPNYLTAGTVYNTGAGADVSASYLVVSVTSSLPNERAVTAGTGIRIVDSGAGGNVVFSVRDDVVSTLTGSTFSGPVVAAGGLSGSLQQLSSGLSYLVAGNNVTISSGTNGQVAISASASSSGLAFTTVSIDLGVSRSSGMFDITGSSGLTPGNPVMVMQTAGAIDSKGLARDEPEMDHINLTGYVLDATTIRVYWRAPSIVVGTYEFAYLVSG